MVLTIEADKTSRSAGLREAATVLAKADVC
jgi:hypothetical protein